MNDNYEPYGVEWERAMMRLPKKELVQLTKEWLLENNKEIENLKLLAKEMIHQLLGNKIFICKLCQESFVKTRECFKVPCNQIDNLNRLIQKAPGVIK